MRFKIGQSVPYQGKTWKVAGEILQLGKGKKRRTSMTVLYLENSGEKPVMVRTRALARWILFARPKS